MLVEARTILARSPARLVDFLGTIRCPKTPSTLLFALSSNGWNEAVTRRIAALTPRSVGCVSAPLQSLEGLSALSLAFVLNEQCTPLRWTTPIELDPADDWASHALGEPALTSHADPTDQFVFDPASPQADIQTVLSFSPPTCGHDFHNAARKKFPSALQIGLSASHTPFVNGLDFTLFQNGTVLPDGAVGLAFHGPKRLQSAFDLDGFRAISAPVKVTSARGNIVHLLGKDKATRFLLAAIHRAGLDTENSKDDEFYLALLPRDSAVPAGGDGEVAGALDEASYEAVLQINSGDPSRGSIAVESEWGPGIGDHVQILHRSLSTEAATRLRDARTERDPSLVRFSATTLEQLYQGRGRADLDFLDVPGVFEACSENGFTLYTGTRSPWTCKFPGVAATLEC